MRIIVGIGGGIAAYKAVMLLRLFAKDGHEVIAIEEVILDESAE